MFSVSGIFLMSQLQRFHNSESIIKKYSPQGKLACRALQGSLNYISHFLNSVNGSILLQVMEENEKPLSKIVGYSNAYNSS